jgi:hypothetical protein
MALRRNGKVADRFHNRVVKLFGHLFQPGKTAWVS